MLSVSVFIPAYNAASHLEWVVGRIPRELFDSLVSVWIINDGSSDATRDVAERIAKTNSFVKAIHFDRNRGYGNAVRKGIELCRNDKCDYAVCVHADGQYPPESIPLFVNEMDRNGIDILQGSRIASGTALSGGMPRYKFIAGKVLTFLENLTFGMHLTDYHSGFLLYSRRALAKVPFDRLSSSFDFDLEVIAFARARGLAIDERPIPTRYADEQSHLNPVTYGLRVVRVMLKYILGRYRS